jgi:hypothetical protein
VPEPRLEAGQVARLEVVDQVVGVEFAHGIPVAAGDPARRVAGDPVRHAQHDELLEVLAGRRPGGVNGRVVPVHDERRGRQ